MNFQEDAILIIFEKDLNNRFDSFIDKTKVKVLNLNLVNKYDKNFFSTIFKRVLYRRKIIKNQNFIIKECKDKKIIFVSNSEGFIALNLIKTLKGSVDGKIVALQHGIFELIDWPNYKVFLKDAINFTTLYFFGIFTIGLGFGRKICDKYIVYCQEYKDFLIKKGWKSDDIIISSYFLKDKNNNFLNNRSKQIPQDNNVLLIVQPMAASGMINTNIEGDLYTKLINVLDKKYEKIFIRQHPFEKVHIKSDSDKLIHTSSKDIRYDLDKASSIVSFMSTVLVDFEEMEKFFIAVYTKHLEFYKSSYIAFNKIYYIDDDEKFSFKIIDNPNRKRKYFYQPGIKTIENLYQDIL